MEVLEKEQLPKKTNSYTNRRSAINFEQIMRRWPMTSLLLQQGLRPREFRRTEAPVESLRRKI
jgi:hypothetical protein